MFICLYTYSYICIYTLYIYIYSVYVLYVSFLYVTIRQLSANHSFQPTVLVVGRNRWVKEKFIEISFSHYSTLPMYLIYCISLGDYSLPFYTKLKSRSSRREEHNRVPGRTGPRRNCALPRANNR